MNSFLYRIQSGVSRSKVCMLACAIIFGILINIAITIFINKGTIYASNILKNQHLNNTLYTDTVIIMDNVDQIRTHDPNGDRFTAAQLYVNLAPVGDRLGLVEITSSPTPKKILDLQDMNSQGKALVNQKLGSFGPVDTHPTAYFTPALQAAKDILQQGSDRNNRKYVVIVTDVVALSGDKEQCASSPDQYHNWFCEAGNLEQQGITVILLGFSKPGSEDALKPTSDYINAHGGTVLPVADGADLAQRLAQTYTELLTSTHPNIFLAKFSGTPDTLTIGAEDKLTNITFVGLGPVGTSVVDVQTPANEHVAGRNDDNYTTVTGKGYWLETVGGGNIVGDWHLKAGNTAPAQMLVIGISEGEFDLLNPAPARPDSQVGVRYVAPGEPVVLRARVTKADNTPPVGIVFTANPGSGNASPFSSDTLPVTTLPDSQEADMSAILQPSSTDYITVGLGKPLTAGNGYFLKTYPIQVQTALTNRGVQLTVPASTLLPIGGGVQISAGGTQSDKQQSLAIFAREATDSSANGIGWTVVANGTGNTTISGNFAPSRGCGTVYKVIALEEVSGVLPNQGQYDYLAYDLRQYTATIEQSTTATAKLSSDPYIEWLPNQATWNLKFSTTVCTPQTISLDVKLQGKNGFTSPAATIQSGSDTFMLPGNTQNITVPPISSSIGGCPISLLEDRTATLRLIPHTDVKAGNTFFQQGAGWDQTVTCPSTLTNARRYPLEAFLLLGLLSVLIFRLVQLPILWFVPPPHIVGEVEVQIDAPSLVTQGGSSTPSSSVLQPITFRVPYRVPVHGGTWYLERRISGTEVLYVFETHESALAVLAFSIMQDDAGHHVGVNASKHATGSNLPEFQTGQSVGQDPVICEGEAIIVGKDLIYPHLKVSL